MICFLNFSRMSNWMVQMKPLDQQHEAQGATQGIGTGIIVPFPVVNKRTAITALCRSESNPPGVDQDEPWIVQTRDALRQVFEELEAVQREVALVIASR
ncbi:hypothetical protein P6U16_26710 (plasmid) [Rhizobium sp. 32-5/1]|uniref:hypothetical protein n=1 Tax=Rhizobium sp. 32-5/1 TaxID=3019602 RepID=UPI00240D1436|nr:hypothetical protein [Rhizobium sp. 32-5/1]WEZ85604.1 hypothetical protein P6U16_26710 [Rhizobium sp. 32-5/1]